MNEKILCVDDEELILRTLKRQLKNNYQVYTATNADEAMKILESEDIPLIISDQRMEPMSGVEFFQKVQREYPNTVRILLTGYADFNDLMDSVNRGKIFRYMLKPWENSELDYIVAEGMELISVRRERDILHKRLSDTNTNLEQIVQKRTEALQMSEEKYRNLIENAADIIFKLDLDGSIIYANPYFNRFVGKEKNETMGQNIDHLLGTGTFSSIQDSIDVMIQEEHETDEKYNAEYQKHDVNTDSNYLHPELILEFEHHIEKPTMSLKISPMYADNVISGYLVIARDITHHKTLQYHLAKMKNEAMRYIDLMTHDFNNINHGLMGFLELIQADKNAGSWMRMYFEKMTELVRLNIDIISTVKSLEILRENPPEMKGLNLHEAIKKAGNMFTNSYIGPKFETKLDEYDESRPVMADRFLNELYYNVYLILLKLNKKGLERLFVDLKPLGNDADTSGNENKLDYKNGWLVTITDKTTLIHDKVKEKFYENPEESPTSEIGSGLSFYFIKILIDRYNGKIVFRDRTRPAANGSTNSAGSVSEQVGFTEIDIILPTIDD